jgi:short-subunit dehydrogenase
LRRWRKAGSPGIWPSLNRLNWGYSAIPEEEPSSFSLDWAINNELRFIMNIFITGASSGIGEALAVRFALPGRVLGLLARRADELDRVAARCREQGATVLTFPIDVRDAQSVHRAGRAFLAEAGHVDVVIANAGVSRRDDDQGESARSREVIETNLLGVIHTFEPFMAEMERAGSGSLVAVSSVAGFRGLPNAGAYSASKAAVNTWMESLRIRLRGRVHVMTVCPGFVDTPMTASNRFTMPWLLTADDAAARIEHGMARRTGVLVFPAPMRWLMAGVRLIPSALYEPAAAWALRRNPDLLKKSDGKSDARS